MAQKWGFCRCLMVYLDGHSVDFDDFLLKMTAKVSSFQRTNQRTISGNTDEVRSKILQKNPDFSGHIILVQNDRPGKINYISRILRWR